MSENEVLNKCNEVFPGIAKSDNYQLKDMVADFEQLSINKGAEKATNALAGLMGDLKIDGVGDLTRKAITASACKDLHEKSQEQNSANSIVEKTLREIDEKVAETVVKHGPHMFAPMLELQAKPNFRNGDWIAPKLSAVEESVKTALERVPFFEVRVVNALDLGMPVTSTPSYYIGMRPLLQGDDKLNAEILKDAEKTMVGTVFKEGGLEYTRLLKLSGEPIFVEGRGPRSNSWSPPNLTLREYRLKAELEKRPHLQVEVRADYSNLKPSYYIAIRPKR